jgi:peptidoglycan hydrolase CwlO-like protein
MKKCIIQGLLYTGVLTAMAWAQEFPQTPQKETLADAIKFEKHKLAAAEAQARKDAAESAQAQQTARTKASPSRKARSQGQADTASKPPSQPLPSKQK